MNIFETLPADVRRALARRELQRRGAGSKFPGLDPALYAQLAASVRSILAGVAADGGSALDAVRGLLQRLETCEATDADLRLLTAVPDGPITALELVQMMVSLDDRV